MQLLSGPSIWWTCCCALWIAVSGLFQGPDRGALVNPAGGFNIPAHCCLLYCPAGIYYSHSRAGDRECMLGFLFFISQTGMFLWITKHLGIVPFCWLCCEHSKVHGWVIRDSKALKPAIGQDSGPLISSSDAQLESSNLGKAELFSSGAGWEGGLMKPYAGHLHLISMDFTSSCGLCFPLLILGKYSSSMDFSNLHEWRWLFSAQKQDL